MEPIDRRHGFQKYSYRRQAYFLNSTCNMAINKRQGHATLPFLKIDIRHWGSPVKGPSCRTPSLAGRVVSVFVALQPHIPPEFAFMNVTNRKSTWPTQTKPSHTLRKVYCTSSHWGSCWVWQVSLWDYQASWIPTYWYLQGESLELGGFAQHKAPT